MKIEIDKITLFKAISNVQGAVNKKSSATILLNVKLDAIDGHLNLTATDMDIVVSDNIVSAVVSENNSTTVPMQTFSDIVRKIPDGARVTLEKSATSNLLTLRSNQMNFCLPTMDSNDFPMITANNIVQSFNIKAKDLLELIDATKFAMSTDEARYYLNGVFLHSKVKENGEKVLRSISTDGHRLALVEQRAPMDLTTLDGVILPRKAVGELVHILNGMLDLTAEVSTSLTKMRVKIGSVTFITKLIDGSFPDYERVIPWSNNTIARFNRKELLDALDRVAIIATDKNRAVKFSLHHTSALLHANTSESGSGNEEVSAEYSGEPVETAFNSRYLLEILAQITSVDICFQFGSSQSVIITSAEQKNGNGSCRLYVIMPVRS